MSTFAFLRPSVHAVRVDDDIVFLDVAADRYLCWTNAGKLKLSADLRSLDILDPEAMADLEAAELLSPKGCLEGPRLGLPSPASDLWPSRSQPLQRADPWNFIRASCDAAIIYPRRSFADLVAFGADRGPAATPDRDPSPEVASLVAGFHRWAYWTPAPAKCLIRSFVLLRLLRRHGHDAHWVFAVRTWPFAAHCWLQAGATVLDDARERLEAYHPILVV
jgi:hypothetical protein